MGGADDALRIRFPTVDVAKHTGSNSVLFTRSGLETMSFPGRAVCLIKRTNGNPKDRAPRDIRFSVGRHNNASVQRSRNIIAFAASGLSISRSDFDGALFGKRVGTGGANCSSVLGKTCIAIILHGGGNSVVCKSNRPVSSVFSKGARSFSVPVSSYPSCTSCRVRTSV